MGAERASRYIWAVRSVMEKIDWERLSSRHPGLDFKGLRDAASRYVDDAMYMLAKGDVESAIAAASYAEGLLDSLRYMGIEPVKWPGLGEYKKVFVAGTFDLIHPGHIELFRYASSLGELNVVVARDSNVIKAKGRKPVMDEESRLAVVSSIKYVNRAILGDEADIMKSVERIKPDIIILGPDQPFDEDWVRRESERRAGKSVKVLRYKEKHEFSYGMRSVTDIIKRICSRTCQEPG